MITALYKCLTTNLPSVKTWYQFNDSRIPSAPKPVGVIELGPLRRTVNNSMGTLREIRLTVNTAPGSWVPVTAACDELRRKLNGLVLARSTGERFRLEYAHDVGPWLDETLKSNAQTVVFTVPEKL